MKHLTLLTLFAATPALAHPGAHLHPHGSGDWLAVVMGLAIVATAGGLAWARSRSRK